MAEGNVDLVRSIYAGWERGDYSNVEWADPKIEFAFVDGPTPGSRTGVAEMAAAWRDALSAFDGLRAEAEEFISLDHERVLVPTRNTGRGHASGVELGEMKTKGANLFQIRGGRVTRLALYWNRERAYADLGLSR